MNKYLVAFLLMVSVLVSNLHAVERTPPGRFSLQAEYLALFPTISQSYFAQEDAGVGLPAGKRFKHELNFQSAYRLSGTYAFCDCLNELQLIWTHLPNFSHTQSINGSFTATQGHPDIVQSFDFASATSRINLEYFALDALYRLWKMQCGGLDLFFRSGLHYANLRFQEKIRYSDALNVSVSPIFNVQNRSKTWGIGPELALDLYYLIPHCTNLWCGRANFSVATSLKGAFLASHHDASFLNVQSSPTEPFEQATSDDQKRWDLVSFWDISVGLNCALAFACFDSSLEVGYEMFSYRNAIDRIFFADDTAEGLSFDLCNDANFQGPYVALQIIF